jgi:hypothetical protein
MSLQRDTPQAKSNKASITLLGHVEKVIPAAHPSLPEKAQIVIEEADHMYREIRVENTLDGVKGKPRRLKLGAEVDIRIETDTKWTVRQVEPN